MKKKPVLPRGASKSAQRPDTAVFQSGASQTPAKLGESPNFARPQQIGPFTLRPLVAADILFLMQIGSPLLSIAKLILSELKATPEERKKAVEAFTLIRKDGETEPEAEARFLIESVETFFVFTRPPAEIRAILAKGREHFRQTALAIIDTLPITALGEINQAIGNHFAFGLVDAFTHGAANPAEN